MKITNICGEVIENARFARCRYIEAIQEAKKYDFIGCDKTLCEANEAYKKAYTSLVYLQADNKNIAPDLWLLHAQDQVSYAETFKVCSKEFIDVYRCTNAMNEE